MSIQQVKIINPKLGLLELAQQLVNLPPGLPDYELQPGYLC